MMFNTISLLALPLLAATSSALTLPKEHTHALSNVTSSDAAAAAAPVIDVAKKAKSKTTKTKTKTKAAATKVAKPAKTKAAAASATAVSCPQSNGAKFTAGSSVFQVQCYQDHYGGDMSNYETATFSDCITLCSNTKGCVDVSYNSPMCYMKSSIQAIQLNNAVWGAQLMTTISTPKTTTTSTTSQKSTTMTTKTSAQKTSTTPTTKAAKTKASKTKAAQTTTYTNPFQTAVIQNKMSSNQNKRGLAYNDPSLTYLFGGASSQVTWQYDWGQDLCPHSNPDFECLPMLWSDSPTLTSTWNATVHAAVNAGSTRVLGFNEPDYSEQANMSPKDAAKSWIEYMQPYADMVELGGPAITGQPSGLVWLQEFYGNLTHMNATAFPDFQPVHWYDQAWNVGWFKIFITDAYEQTGVPVWITEFQGFGTDAQQAAFFEEVSPWLDANSWVGGYAYFGVFNDNLVNFNGTNENVSGWPMLSLTGQAFDSYYNKTIPAAMQ